MECVRTWRDNGIRIDDSKNSTVRSGLFCTVFAVQTQCTVSIFLYVQYVFYLEFSTLRMNIHLFCAF